MHRRDGPLGEGSLQLWVEQDPERLADPSGGLVEVVAPDDLPAGWHAVVSGQDEEGGQVGYCNLPDGSRVEEWEYMRSQTEASGG